MRVIPYYLGCAGCFLAGVLWECQAQHHVAEFIAYVCSCLMVIVYGHLRYEEGNKRGRQREDA